MFGLKKFRSISLAIACMMLAVCFGGLSASAEEVTVLATYDSKTAYNEKTQGAGNWYYREYSSGKNTDMTWQGDSKGWRSADGEGDIKIDGMGASGVCDTDLVFTSDFKGVIRIKSSAVQMAWTGYQGDGVAASISKNTKELWSGDVYGAEPVETELTVSVKKGDEIHFRINCKAHNAYDAITWWPVVERIQGEYVNDDKCTYYQFDGSRETQLTEDPSFNDGEGGYIAADGIAFMSDSAVMPTDSYSIIKRCTAGENGRYRIYGSLNSADSRGGGNIVTISKNGEKVWKQLFVENEDGNFDVRMLASKGDVFDVMVSVNTFTGYNRSEWDCSVVKYMGTLPCDASSIGGSTYATVSEYDLGSLAEPGRADVRFYSVMRDVEYPMTYDSASQMWKSQIAGDGGYVSANKALPGRKADTVMEQTINADGTIRIVGDMPVSGNSDGVLSTILLNGEKLWSSRVGGERSVRWDEKYDTSYFLNRVDVTAEVKSGDKLTYVFNLWRLVQNDEVDISRVKFKYISGGELSRTTKWKLKQSIVIDTANGKAYKNGAAESMRVYVGEEATYAAKGDFADVVGIADLSGVSTTVINGVEYIPIRAAAEQAGKAVDWAADRYVLIYDGIPVMFGYPEHSEISVAAAKGVISFE